MSLFHKKNRDIFSDHNSGRLMPENWVKLYKTKNTVRGISDPRTAAFAWKLIYESEREVLSFLSFFVSLLFILIFFCYY